MRQIQIFLIIILSILFSDKLLAQKQNQVNPNGESIFYYENGQVSSKGKLKNGKPDGFWQTFHESGTLKSEGSRKDFLLDSVWCFYSEKGHVIEKITYLAGKKNGYYFKYKFNEKSDSNILISKELYLKDLKNGKSFYYYPSGEIHELINFRDGLRHGRGVEFSPDSLIVTMYQFRNDYTIEKRLINRRDSRGMKQGVWQEFFSIERLKTDAYYVNDKLHGYYKEYDRYGKLLKAVRYEHGEIVKEKEKNKPKIKIKKTYYAAGKLKTSGSYIDSIPVGVHREFSENGKVVAAKTFRENGSLRASGIVAKNGKKEGVWKYFYKSGELKSQGSYKRGLKTGEWVYYFRSGAVEQKGHFKKGRFSGLWTWYYESGSRLREEEFLAGKEDGKLIEYSETGDSIVQGNYVEGEKSGKWVYRIGNQTETGNYRGNLKDGIWRQFYADGTLKYEGEYAQGGLNGKHTYYYETGDLKEVRHYIAGSRDGQWRKFDKNGTLLLSVSYKNDKLVKIDGTKIE